MKLPYIKLYTADLLAASRNLTLEQIGAGVMGVCELAFENDTAYTPQTAREIAFFEMLTRWKEESLQSVQLKKKAGRKGGKRTQQKKKEIDESTACLCASNTPNKHTDTDTNTETENITPIPPVPLAAQGESVCPGDSQKNRIHSLRLLAFANQVLTHYETNIKTDIQKSIWLRKNRRHLRDIFNFCGADITLALRTIRVCILRLKQAGLTGGYGAVCRHLPDYAAQAQKELEEEYGYSK